MFIWNLAAVVILFRITLGLQLHAFEIEQGRVGIGCKFYLCRGKKEQKAM